MLYVAGTGSFALDVVEIARDAGHEVHGLLELLDADRVGTTIHGLPVLDPADAPAGAAAVVGAGGDRLALRRRLDAANWGSATVVHPLAHVPRSVTLGLGVVCGPGVVLGAAATVGDEVLLGRGALVGHHTALGDGTVVNPGANVAGNVTIGAGVLLAMGCVVRDHVTVGDGAVVAAGAVVVADVAPGTQVRGVPARVAA